MSSNRASAEFPTTTATSTASLQQQPTGAFNDGTAFFVTDEDKFFRLSKSNDETPCFSIRTTGNSSSGNRAGRWLLGLDALTLFQAEVTTTDATPVSTLVAPSLPLTFAAPLIISLAAFDGSGTQLAAALEPPRSIYRVNGGPITIDPATNINLGFVPGAPPWNTITAQLVGGPNLTLTTTGLAATTIHWSLSVEIRA